MAINNLKEDRQLERLRYIDLCAYVLGAVKRKTLMERFDVSGVYASKDFAQYQSETGERLRYENRLKQYIPVDWFTPLYDHDATDALMLISQGVQYIKCESNLYERFHENEVPKVGLDLEKIAPVLRATYRTRKAEIEYISRSSGTSKRLIVPHSVITVGNFFYLRAFDYKSGEFRNFKLNRITASYFRDEQPDPKMKIDADKKWHSKLNITIIANEGHKHPEALEADYGLNNGQMEVTVRQAMLHYFLMDWNIAPLGYELPHDLFPLRVKHIN